MELWKDVPGYEGCYKVSNKGKVKSLSRKFSRGDKIMLNQKNKQGYEFVGLSNANGCKCVKVHRLVALCFINNRNYKPEVNHIDGNKSNNCVSNLEWSTVSENRQHAYDTGLNNPESFSGEKNGRSKINKEDVLLIRKMKSETKITYTELATMFNVCSNQISKIVRRVNWKHI